MATPIQKKYLRVDEKTQLEIWVYIWALRPDAKAETVTVEYEEVIVAPNGEVCASLKRGSYLRYNRPIIYYQVGEVMEAGKIAVGGEVIPASDPVAYYNAGDIVAEGTISVGGEIKKEANMKFDSLRASPLGVGITDMLGVDLADYPDVEQD